MAAGFDKWAIGGCCCEPRPIIIAMCNANTITDDDFHCYLDNNDLGIVTGGSNTCTGHAWTSWNGQPAMSVANVDFSGTNVGFFYSGACCQAFTPSSFDSAWASKGSHTYRMDDILDQGSGNWGTVIIAKMKLVNNVWQVDSYLVRSTYSNVFEGGSLSYGFSI